MHTRLKLIFVVLAAFAASSVHAQDGNSARDKEKLQMIALEALIHVPEERALPAVRKLLQSGGSDELMESAMFVLGQMDSPDAAQVLLEYARNGSGDAQEEAIQMIGMNGDTTAMAALSDIYANGDEDVREAVLEAYHFADDIDAVFAIAMAATDEEDYEDAVEMLAIMDAHEQLARLREAKGSSEALIDAYIISDNHEELEKLARDDTDRDVQAEAIEALGIVGGPNTEAVLVEIYKAADHDDIREAALEGLFIGDYDSAILELYRSSTSAREKGDLLEALVVMDSDFAMDVIDQALAGDQ
jgi:HEAT repeat protein